MIQTSPYLIAKRFIGLKEIPGMMDNPMIVAMLQLHKVNEWAKHDEVPWCSAFVSYVAWLLGLPHSKSLQARSWLLIGEMVDGLDNARMDSDVVVLKRGSGYQPGPEILDAPGHVMYYAGRHAGKVLGIGGNQNNSVNVSSYDVDLILGIRRLS